MSVGSKFYFLSFDNRQTLLEAPPPLAANGWVFAFVAHAESSILARISKGNDANTLLCCRFFLYFLCGGCIFTH